jgi:hypothetical protein
VKLGRIVLTDSRGDAALGVLCVTVINTAFSDNKHAALLPSQQGSIQPGNAATDYNIIVLHRSLSGGFLVLTLVSPVLSLTFLVEVAAVGIVYYGNWEIGNLKAAECLGPKLLVGNYLGLFDAL